MNDGNCIWIVEDSVRDVVASYLDPLERIAADFGDSFPRVHVLVLGVSEWDDAEIKKLNKERSRRYPRTLPMVEWPQQHEQDPEAFVEDLRQRVRPNDVVLVDGTVCGRAWPHRDEGYIRHVFNALRAERPNDARVVLVTSVAKLDPEGWKDHHGVTLPKDLNGSTDLYDAALKEKITPSQPWTAGLNETGKELLQPYVERLRKAREGRIEFDAIGTLARTLLLDLLDLGREPPTSLSEAVNKQPRTNPDNVALRKVLIQRRVLYGMRQLWLESAPDRDNEKEYLLWLEVVAAGFHWYEAEQNTVKNLPLWAKKGELDGTLKRVSLRADQQFRGKYETVTKASVEPIERGIKHDASGAIRFIEAGVSFHYKGEGPGRPRYHYDLVVPTVGGPLPGDGAASAEWDQFWANRRIARAAVRCTRVGHVEAVHSGLTYKNHFLNHDIMSRMLFPMDEELSWWRRVRPELASRLKAASIFDARQQSARRMADDPADDGDDDSPVE